MDVLQRTALFDNHVAGGGRLVPFAGWEMPVQYKGVLDEVRAVRTGWGVFDVSHMGQLTVRGEGATAALNEVVSADWAALPQGRVGYALLLNDDGGVIDDIMGYRLGLDSWLVVVNASRAEIDEAHLRAHLPARLDLRNRYENQVMLAVQGPEAAAGLAATLPDPALATLNWRDVVERDDTYWARGGYTGCDGFEVMCSAAAGADLWQRLMEAGCTPCGLAARDALRLEAALPLYGHELKEEWTPYQSGCGFAVKLDKGNFIGREALLAKQQPAQRVRALRMEGKAIPRDGYIVAENGHEVGVVTSGGFSPQLGCGIALSLLPAAAAVGDAFDVVVRGVPQPARLVKPPFVAPGRKSQ